MAHIPTTFKIKKLGKIKKAQQGLQDIKQVILSRVGQIDMEKCMVNAGGKYDLILIAAQRARELAAGDVSIMGDSGKPIVTALLEIQAGLLDREEYKNRLVSRK